jgi:hypothetical protein
VVKRKRKHRICRGKKDYEEVQQARWDALHLSKRDWKIVDVFLCPTCDGTHVGHAPVSRTPNTVIARFDRGREVTP